MFEETEAQRLRRLFPGPKSERELGPGLWLLASCRVSFPSKAGGKEQRSRDPPAGPTDRGLESKGKQNRRPRRRK